MNISSKNYRLITDIRQQTADVGTTINTKTILE